MPKITYLISISEDSSNLEYLFNSLDNIQGDFRKEYIILANGLPNKTIAEIKFCSKNLTNKILIKNKFNDKLESINKIKNIIQGEYIHFVNENDILHKQSSLYLLDAINTYKCEVAFGESKICHTIEEITQKIEQNKLNQSHKIEKPFSALLNKKNFNLFRIGGGASLIKNNLFQKIFPLYGSYKHDNVPITLHAATQSDFAYIADEILITTSEVSKKIDITEYSVDILHGLNDILEYDYEIVDNNLKKIQRSIASLIWNLHKKKVKYFPEYIKSKFFSKKLNKIALTQMIVREIENLKY